jgi:hypothetical protein
MRAREREKALGEKGNSRRGAVFLQGKNYLKWEKSAQAALESTAPSASLI